MCIFVPVNTIVLCDRLTTVLSTWGTILSYARTVQASGTALHPMQVGTEREPPLPGARAYSHPCPRIGSSHPNGLAQIYACYIEGTGPSKLRGPNWGCAGWGWEFQWGLTTTSNVHPIPGPAHLPAYPPLPRNALLPAVPRPRRAAPLAERGQPSGALPASHSSIDASFVLRWTPCTGAHMLYGTCVTALGWQKRLASPKACWLLAFQNLRERYCLVLLSKILLTEDAKVC